MQEIIKTLLTKIGEDPEREGLVKTPERVEKAWEFLTKGYDESLDELVNDALFTSDCRDMVIVKNIEVYSLCEHHLLPFFGHCHIGYIPKGKVLGVSKLARIVDHFGRRLQIQEQLTHQIAQTVMDVLEPEGVGVIMEAKHLCMMMRGVEKQNSEMVTSSMQGQFRSALATREEFLRLVGK